MKIRSMTALFAGILLAGFAVACNSTPAAAPAGGGASGTATGTAQGFHGEVSVTITMVDGAITAVEMDLSNDTPNFAAMVEGTAANDMIRFNTYDIDTVSGATGTSGGVRAAAQSAVEQIRAAAAQASVAAPAVEESVETVE